VTYSILFLPEGEDVNTVSTTFNMRMTELGDPRLEHGVLLRVMSLRS